MTGVYGLFTTPELAQQAVDELRASGVPENEITVQSSEPMQEYAFGARDRDTLMPWIAVLGAAIGMATGYFLTSITQQAWPISTGAMPIVTNWSNLIIIFELTMLGAVFASVITLMFSAKLPGRMPKFYDLEVSYGKILIGVANPRNVERVEHALRASIDGVRKKEV
jgi:ActD protein